jgi:hypothetical protein
MYRISCNGQEPIIDVDQVETIEPSIRSSAAGRYHLDDISADPFSCGHSSRRLGVGINRQNGTVAREPDRWDA